MLLGRQERGGEKSTHRAREAGLRGGRKAGAPRRGVSGYWRGCGGRSAFVCSVCTVDSNAGGDLESSLNLGSETQTLRVRVRGDYFPRLHTPFSMVGLAR